MNELQKRNLLNETLFKSSKDKNEEYYAVYKSGTSIANITTKTHYENLAHGFYKDYTVLCACKNGRVSKVNHNGELLTVRGGDWCDPMNSHLFDVIAKRVTIDGIGEYDICIELHSPLPHLQPEKFAIKTY